MIDIHVSGHSANELLAELRALLGGCNEVVPAHVVASLVDSQDSPKEEPKEEPKSEEPKNTEPSCTLEELRGVLNALRVQKGLEAVREALAVGKVNSLTDLPKERYDAVMAKATDLIKEEG